MVQRWSRLLIDNWRLPGNFLSLLPSIYAHRFLGEWFLQILQRLINPSANPYSWKEYANMLYIDQLAGVGILYQSGESTPSITCDDCQSGGVINAAVEVNSIVAAAPFVWKFMQAFFAQFPKYESRDLRFLLSRMEVIMVQVRLPYFPSVPPLANTSRIFIIFRTAEQGDRTWHYHWRKVQLGSSSNQQQIYDSIIQERQEIEFYYKNSYYLMINESIYESTYESLITGYEDLCLSALKKCTSAAGSNLNYGYYHRRTK